MFGTMSRLATDRKDWKVIAECSEHGEDHLALSASATCTKLEARDAIPVENCPGCGAEMSIIVEEKPTEVLK